MNTQNAKKTETLVEKSMNTQLSNWFILYSKLHRFHWYVKGLISLRFMKNLKSCITKRRKRRMPSQSDFWPSEDSLRRLYTLTLNKLPLRMKARKKRLLKWWNHWFKTINKSAANQNLSSASPRNKMTRQLPTCLSD